MKALRSAALIALSLSLALGPTPAQAVNTDAGLFGSSDPTYDGIFRQSLSILALKAVNQPVPASAVKWLMDQQCPDGSFQAYRANLSTPCTGPNFELFTGKDSNSTAIGAAALQSVGKTARAAQAIKWLTANQNADGGMSFFKGGSSDASSTALTIFALRSIGSDPTKVKKNGKSLFDFLYSVMGDCSTGNLRGGLKFQNAAWARVDDMTTAPALAMLGNWPVLARNDFGAANQISCPGGKVATPVALQAAMSGYLVARLGANSNTLPSAIPGGGTDWTSTGWATLGLISAGKGKKAVQGTIAQLKKNVKAVVGNVNDANPGRTAVLLMVAKSTAQDYTNFGGQNLKTLLLRTLR